MKGAIALVGHDSQLGQEVGAGQARHCFQERRGERQGELRLAEAEGGGVEEEGGRAEAEGRRRDQTTDYVWKTS